MNGLQIDTEGRLLFIILVCVICYAVNQCDCPARIGDKLFHVEYAWIDFLAFLFQFFAFFLGVVVELFKGSCHGLFYREEYAIGYLFTAREQ